MKMAVPRKAAPPSAPTKAQSMSENCRARNSDKKEGGQSRRRRSEICRETRKKSQEGDFPVGPVAKTWPSSAGGAGLIPGWGAKRLHASQPTNQNIKQKQYCNKFNKDFAEFFHQKNLKKKRKSRKSQEKVAWKGSPQTPEE